MSISLYLSRSK